MSSVEFLPGIQANGIFTFTRRQDGSQIDLEICKKETAERTYKLAITYLGLDKHDRDSWRIQINDQTPLFSGKRVLGYHASRRFDVRPFGLDAIQIEEADENIAEKIWIDVSGKRHTVSRTPVELDERIQSLVQRAKLFKPSDDKEIKKIFYNNSVGVIIYARDQRWETDIYFAKKGDDEFVKCDSKMMMQCKCPQGDSEWEVKLPDESGTHKFTFAQAAESDEGHDSDTSWDGFDLKKIVV